MFGRFLLLFFAAICSVTAAQPQATVGNGTVMAPSAGQREAYGLNSGQADTAGAFPTRHHGTNSSGIGGSSVGTTSPTSESSPAVAPASRVPKSVVQFRLPQLNPGYQEVFGTPALQTFTPALPSVPRSTALTDPFGSRDFGNDYSSGSSLESLPSFSRRSSLINKMQFDSFGQH